MYLIFNQNEGELRAYSDQKSLNASGQSGTVLPPNDVVALRRAYYASVSQTDAMVGRVMAALAASPFASNTIVSLWGDHGWQLGEHGEWCKHTNFELAARAPMMVHVPGEFILFTVTFCTNPANNLTCPPHILSF